MKNETIFKKKKKTLIIVVGLVFLIGISGLVIYLFPKNSETKSSNHYHSPITIQQLESQISQLEQTLNQPQWLSKTELRDALNITKLDLQRISQKSLEANQLSKELKSLKVTLDSIQQLLSIPPLPNPTSLSQLSEQELEKTLLEDFSRRLQLEKYFVFSSRELDDHPLELEIEEGNWTRIDFARKLSPNLALDFNQLLGSPKNFIYFSKRGLWLDKSSFLKLIGKDDPLNSPEVFIVFDKTLINDPNCPFLGGNPSLARKDGTSKSFLEGQTLNMDQHESFVSENPSLFTFEDKKNLLFFLLTSDPVFADREVPLSPKLEQEKAYQEFVKFFPNSSFVDRKKKNSYEKFILLKCQSHFFDNEPVYFDKGSFNPQNLTDFSQEVVRLGWKEHNPFLSFPETILQFDASSQSFWNNFRFTSLYDFYSIPKKEGKIDWVEYLKSEKIFLEPFQKLETYQATKNYIVDTLNPKLKKNFSDLSVLLSSLPNLSELNRLVKERTILMGIGNKLCSLCESQGEEHFPTKDFSSSLRTYNKKVLDLSCGVFAGYDFTETFEFDAKWGEEK